MVTIILTNSFNCRCINARIILFCYKFGFLYTRNIMEYNFVIRKQDGSKVEGKTNKNRNFCYYRSVQKQIVNQKKWLMRYTFLEFCNYNICKWQIILYPLSPVHSSSPCTHPMCHSKWSFIDGRETSKPVSDLKDMFDNGWISGIEKKWIGIHLFLYWLLRIVTRL